MMKVRLGGRPIHQVIDGSGELDPQRPWHVLPRTVERLRALSPMWDEYQHGAMDSVTNPRPAPRGPGQ